MLICHNVFACQPRNLTKLYKAHCLHYTASSIDTNVHVYNLISCNVPVGMLVKINQTLTK